MGDPRRPKRKYETPRKPWDVVRLQEELRLLGEYGLRNKREIWRYRTLLSRFRHRARTLLAEPPEVREKEGRVLVEKLQMIGVLPEGAGLDDVLDLKIEDFLERRLQTVVYKMGLARSIVQARQMITHGHISVGDRVVRVPSYMVKRGEEKLIRYSEGSPFNNPDHPVRKTLVAVAAEA